MHHDIPLADPSLDQFADLPNQVRVCFRTYGPAGRPAVVLIVGLGLQQVYWPMAFIDGIVAAGFQVITLDNRDSGRSSYMAHKPPARWQLLMDMVPKGHYPLRDMAEDVALLLEHLHIDKAHIIGMSMGGMIAQTMAAKFADKVASLTSIFSTTGNKRVGRAAGSTILRMLFSQPALTLEAAQDKYVRMLRHIGNPKAPGIEAAWRNYVAQAWQRTTPEQSIAGYERQIAAMLISGDRTGQLYSIDTPTLVLHGDKDRIVHPSGGSATARAIGGSQFCTVQGMRHQIDAMIAPYLLQVIVPHLQQAQQLPTAPTTPVAAVSA